MSTEQSMEQKQTPPQPCVVLQGEDGSAYLIPQAALDTFRLSDEQRAELQAHSPAADDDVHGHQYIGQFQMTMYYPTFGWDAGRFELPWAPVTSYYPPLH
jgi:hypothetical protein